jgi:signal transduction histidine kinase
MKTVRRRGAGLAAANAAIADAIPELVRALAARAPAGPRGERARNLLAGLTAMHAARRPFELPEVFAAFERELARLDGDPESVHEWLRALVHEQFPELLGDPALAQWVEAPHRMSSMMTWLLRANAEKLESLQGELGDSKSEVSKLRAELARLQAEHGAVVSELERRRTLSDVGLLAAGIVHDFNNVLHTISGQATTVRSRADERDAEAMDRVLEATHRAAEMTHRLLLWVRHTSVKPEPVDVSAMADEVLDLLGPSAPPRVLLVRRLAPGLPMVMADPVELRRVVLNLVVNAWEAIGGNPGRVTVSTGAAEGRRAGTWLEVADDGRGMDADTTERVFEPFFSTRTDGTGLGLSLVREIVDRLDGEIEVASRPGEGTRFRVVLPELERGATPTA